MEHRHNLVRLLLAIAIGLAGFTPVLAKDTHQGGEVVVRLAGMDEDEIGALEQQGIRLSRLTDGRSIAAVTDSQLAGLRNQGFDVEVLKSGGRVESEAAAQAEQLSNEHLTLSVIESGQFTMWTADGKDLLYPAESTGYLSVNVDGAVYDNDDGSLTVSTPLTPIDDSSAYIGYETPEGVRVTQRFLLSGEAVRLEVEASNGGGAEHHVSVRYLLDTQVDVNDGSPLYASTVGVRTYETDMPSPSFHSWRGYDVWPSPTLTSVGTFSTQPDRAVFAWWPEAVGHDWAYAPDPDQRFYTPGYTSSPASDSCVLLYFTMGTLGVGDQDAIVTYYGVGEPEADTDRERLIAAFESFKEAVKSSAEADLDAFSALQARYLFSLRNDWHDYLEAAWTVIGMAVPDPGDIAKLGKGWELLEHVVEVIDYIDMADTIAAQLTDLLDAIPTSATEEEIKNEYIYDRLMEDLTVELPSGETYPSIAAYLQAIDTQFESYAAQIPDPLPPDYPVNDTIFILEQQTAGLNASAVQETYVSIIYEDVCQLAKLGVLQEQDEAMERLARRLRVAGDVSFWMTLGEIGTLLGSAGLKVTGIVATPVTAGSSTLLTVSSETVFWSTVAGITAIEGALGGAADVAGIGIKDAMTNISYSAIMQLATDLPLRYAVFEHTSEWVTTVDAQSAVELLASQAQAEPQVISVTVPNLSVSSDQTWARGTGQAVVGNPGTSEVNVTLYGSVTARIGDEIATVGLLDGNSTALAPGEQATIPFDYTVLRSSFVHHTGYDVHVFVTGMDAGGIVAITGPFVAHFFAGTAPQLAQLSSQTHSTILRGMVSSGEVVTQEVGLAPGTQQGYLLLSFIEGADQDLHLYDGSGNHVGVNYDTGEIENQIPGAVYSGATVWPEWIRLENPGLGPYQAGIVGQNTTAGKGYDLSKLETPELPAGLDTVPQISWGMALGDSGSTITESFGLPVFELGGSHAVSNLQASAGDLMLDTAYLRPASTGVEQNGGRTLSGLQLSCTAPDEVPPGGGVLIRCIVTIDATAQPGAYTGSIEIGGSAPDGSPLATSSQATLRLLGPAPAVGGVTRPSARFALPTPWWPILALLGLALVSGLAWRRRVR